MISTETIDEALIALGERETRYRRMADLFRLTGGDDNPWVDWADKAKAAYDELLAVRTIPQSQERQP